MANTADPMVIHVLASHLMDTCPSETCREMTHADDIDPVGDVYRAHWLQAKKLIEEFGWVNRS